MAQTVSQVSFLVSNRQNGSDVHSTFLASHRDQLYQHRKAIYHKLSSGMMGRPDYVTLRHRMSTVESDSREHENDVRSRFQAVLNEDGPRAKLQFQRVA